MSESSKSKQKGLMNNGFKLGGVAYGIQLAMVACAAYLPVRQIEVSGVRHSAHLGLPSVMALVPALGALAIVFGKVTVHSENLETGEIEVSTRFNLEEFDWDFGKRR